MRLVLDTNIIVALSLRRCPNFLGTFSSLPSSLFLQRYMPPLTFLMAILHNI